MEDNKEEKNAFGFTREDYKKHVYPDGTTYLGIPYNPTVIPESEPKEDSPTIPLAKAMKLMRWAEKTCFMSDGRHRMNDEELYELFKKESSKE